MYVFKITSRVQEVWLIFTMFVNIRKTLHNKSSSSLKVTCCRFAPC